MEQLQKPTKNTQDGIPSPNPSYPSDIEVVKGDNEVVVSNKNWFNLNNFGVINSFFNANTTTLSNTSNNYRSIYISCKPNTTYTISKMLSARFSFGYTTEIPIVGTTIYGAKTKDTSTEITITTGADAKYLIAFLYHASYDTSITPEQIYQTIQIEQNTQATSLVEHAEQVYPISLGSIELAKIGNYQGKLFKAINGDVVYDSLSTTQKEGLTSGKWYKLREISKYTFTGNENTQYISVAQGSLFRVTVVESISNIPMYCNYFTGIANATGRTNGNFYYNASASTDLNRWDFIDNRYTSADDFKAFLGTAKPILYYILATPTFTEITDETLIEQLENWRNSKSYQGQTNISQTNEDKAFVISYTTLKDVYSELDSRLKALEG